MQKVKKKKLRQYFHNVLKLCNILVEAKVKTLGSPQVKGNLISTTNLVHGFPHELPNDVRLKTRTLKFPTKKK